MRKMLLFALVLACSVSMVFAAVDINAESMASGDIASGTDIGGAVTSGNAEVEAAEAGAPYASVLVLPEGSSLSFDGTAGDVLKISQAIPADDTASGIMIESDSSSELIEGSSSDGMIAYSEYTLPADGAYTLSPAAGSAYIYSIASGN